MASLRPDVDSDGLLEHSVVFTDRSLNHRSQAVQGIMRDIHAPLCEVYKADRAILVPGGGDLTEICHRRFARPECGFRQWTIAMPYELDDRNVQDEQEASRSAIGSAALMAAVLYAPIRKERRDKRHVAGHPAPPDTD